MHDAPALWAPSSTAQLVTLAAAPAEFAGAAILPALVPRAACGARGAHHLVIDHGDLRHRLHILEPDLGAPLVILLAPSRDPLRAACADAARRLIAGISTAPGASAMRPSALQRRRLALLLGVLDRACAGATTRAIGTGLVYPWLAQIGAQAWKSSSERRQVQRLIEQARALMQGGYRTLLSG